MPNKIILLSVLALLLWPSLAYAQAQGQDIICPDAPTALRQAPDDLSKVQADIDRFTLCLERAQLLKRLNDLAVENDEALQNASMSASTGFGLDAGTQAVDFNPFDINDVLGVDDALIPAENSGEEEMVFGTEDWVVLSVFGTGQDLSAKLAKSDGNFAQVKTGQALPDGSEVLSITTDGVKVREGGENRTLYWHERMR